MPYEITLQKLLESLDKELHGRILNLETKARPLLSYSQGKFPFYTPHDFHHSISVEENLNWIIPDQLKEKLNKYEIFFLICAAWLHDWGMIGSEGEKPEDIRENHHIRTESNFETLNNTLGFNLHEGRIIGRICKGHRKVDLHSKEFDDMTFGQGVRIQTRFLSALLRIADETDITFSRTPEVIYYSLNPTDKSEEEFKKHLHISGIGQLDEPYKIYITAISRDPKGAQTLRDLTSKIQRELDSIKSILNQNGLFLDIVELKMETRGFIDKPIAFEINRNKIVDLLIGKHLYGRKDVAIRELVQNAIDTCSYKKAVNETYDPKITLSRDTLNQLTITDNGYGMGFFEAKKFLSNIGTSFYQSEEFKNAIENKSYDPISYFGIGLLSSFLIADGMTIESKKQGDEACKFTITSLSGDWKYEKGSLKDSGTTITLSLNKEGEEISLLNSLNSYFIENEIPIFYKEIGDELKTFNTSWSIKSIKDRFLEKDERRNNILKKIVEINNQDFQLILVKSNYYRNNLVLFNHGVFVNRLNILGLGIGYNVFLNLKSNIIDLHISRENVIENEKFSNFLIKVFDELFITLKKKDKDPCLLQYISTVTKLIESRMYLEEFDYAEMPIKYPFLHSYMNNIVFPVVKNGQIQHSSFHELCNSNSLILYKSTSNDYTNELYFFQKLKKDDFVFFNPYLFPDVSISKKSDYAISFIDYIIKVKKLKVNKIDLRTILIDQAVPFQNNYKNILPDNIEFVSFGNINPLVVLKSYPIVNEKYHYYGFGYWGGILLWKKLVEVERLQDYEKHFKELHGDRFDSVTIIKDPEVIIDINDEFISSIIEIYDKIDPNDYKIFKRYFKYLSYLPLIYFNLESCIIAIEVIENLEKSISDLYKLTRPPELFKRMKPSASLFLHYFEKSVEFDFE